MKSTRKIETEAAAWLALRDQRALTVQEQAGFDSWLRENSRHPAIYRQILASWRLLDQPSENDEATLLRNQLNALDRKARQRRKLAAGAMLLAAACLALAFFLPGLHPTSRLLAGAERPSAQVLEVEQRLLPDGSRVLLKPGAEIKERFTEHTRAILLIRGEAHFSVVSNPKRPFVVSAQRVAFRAVGTAFSVQLGQKEVEVLVTQGKVTIESKQASSSPNDPLPLSPPATLIGVRQRAIVSLLSHAHAPAVESLTEAEVEEHMSWSMPRLDFSETTLDEAVALINRYSQVKILLGSKEVGSMRITGVFRCDNAEGFVRALESTLGIRAKWAQNEISLHKAM